MSFILIQHLLKRELLSGRVMYARIYAGNVKRSGGRTHPCRKTGFNYGRFGKAVRFCLKGAFYVA